MRLHPDASKIEAYLRRQGIRALYHFTDINNLPRILQQGGLRSKDWLERNNLLPLINTGGNQLSKDLDLRHGNWDKVSLSFCPKLPMAYYREAEQHLCYVVVKLEVALRQGVWFTDRNATDNDEKRDQGFRGLQLVDFNAVRATYPYGSQERKKKKQAEVLIPNFVPLADIRGFLFRSESSRKEAERLCGVMRHPPFEVQENAFIREHYSYVEDHLLTSAQVMRDNVWTVTFDDERVFNLRQDLKLTLVATLKATTGVEGRVVWSNMDGVALQESSDGFEKTDTYRAWPSLSTIDLQEGEYQVAYYLSGIRQFVIPFILLRRKEGASNAEPT